MPNRQPTDWNKQGAIAGYLTLFVSVVGITAMLWLGLRQPSPAAPVNVQTPTALPGVHIMPLSMPWLFGALYAAGIVIGGYCQLKAAQINRFPRTIGQSKNNRITSWRLWKRYLWDAVSDFSISENPAGSWQYGWSNNQFGSDFDRFTRNRPDVEPELDRWDTSQIIDLGIMRNRTGHEKQGSTYIVLPDALHMHPGPKGEYDIVRWTCPKNGKYTITGQFLGLDRQANAECDVNVVLNCSRSLFSDLPVLRGIPTEKSFAFFDVSLSEANTVDFIVGFGPSRSHGSDSTGLKARIILQ